MLRRDREVAPLTGRFIVLAMRRIAIIAFGCLLLSTVPTHAQSPDQTLNDFLAQVLKQRLILQNYKCRSNNKLPVDREWPSSAPPKLRTLGVFSSAQQNFTTIAWSSLAADPQSTKTRTRNRHFWAIPLS